MYFDVLLKTDQHAKGWPVVFLFLRGVPPESRAAFSSPTPKPPAGKPRTPNSAKRRGVRSPISPSTAAMDTDNTPIMDLKALNDYKKQSRRELMQMNKENRSSFDSAYSPELPPSKSRAELEKYYDRKKKKVAKSEVKLPEEVPGARPKSKTGFQPRIKSRTGSRPTSRANSRAASRTGSRLSVSGWVKRCFCMKNFWSETGIPIAILHALINLHI